MASKPGAIEVLELSRAVEIEGFRIIRAAVTIACAIT
jgi:hypothetical protein